MPTALKVGIRSKRELYLLKELAKGSFEFEDLNEEEKYIVYNSESDISTVVPVEQIREYESMHSMSRTLSPMERMKRHVRAITGNIAGRLKEGQ